MTKLPAPSPKQIDEYFNYSTFEDSERDYVERVITRSHQLVAQHFKEQALREEYPGLKSIWEQYQVALTLVSSSGTPVVNT